MYFEFYLIVVAGLTYSTNMNTNNQNAGRTQNRNKNGNSAIDLTWDGTSRANFDKLDLMLESRKAQMIAEKQGYLPIPMGENFAEERMIEESRSQRISNPVAGDNVASDQIYQHGSLDNPFENMRSAAGKNNRKHFTKQ